MVKTADGKIAWVKPDAETVEGLASAIEAIEAVIGEKASVDGEGNPVAATGLIIISKNSFSINYRLIKISR